MASLGSVPFLYCCNESVATDEGSNRYNSSGALFVEGLFCDASHLFLARGTFAFAKPPIGQLKLGYLAIVVMKCFDRVSFCPFGT